MATLNEVATGLAVLKWKRHLTIPELAKEIGIGREKTRDLLHGEDVALTHAEWSRIYKLIGGIT